MWEPFSRGPWLLSVEAPSGAGLALGMAVEWGWYSSNRRSEVHGQHFHMLGPQRTLDLDKSWSWGSEDLWLKRVGKSLGLGLRVGLESGFRRGGVGSRDQRTFRAPASVGLGPHYVACSSIEKHINLADVHSHWRAQQSRCRLLHPGASLSTAIFFWFLYFFAIFFGDPWWWNSHLHAELLVKCTRSEGSLGKMQLSNFNRICSFLDWNLSLNQTSLFNVYLFSLLSSPVVHFSLLLPLYAIKVAIRGFRGVRSSGVKHPVVLCKPPRGENNPT